MSGKEEERFKGSEIDSLEEKLRKKKSKADEQLQEVILRYTAHAPHLSFAGCYTGPDHAWEAFKTARALEA